MRLIATGLVLLIATNLAEAQPRCAGHVEARDMRVVRVEKNADLVLADGRAVRLEGLLLPAGIRDHAPSYLASEAIATLGDLVRGRHVALFAPEPREDRYGRLRAQVFISDAVAEPWLQFAMLARGFARVSMAPDRPECASELYAAEAAARDKRYGIWGTQFYAIRAPDNLADALGTFQIVEGRVSSAAVNNSRGYIDFGSDWRRDFKVTISPEDMKHFRDAGIDPRNYGGYTLRVRGFVDRLGGPEIEVASPAGIEVVNTP